MKVAQWLVKTFSLNAEDVRSDNNGALHSACYSGNLELVKWLCTFNLGIEDIRSKYSEYQHCLYKACSGNHLGIAEWLHSNFNLMNENKRVYILSLCDACEKGNLAIAKWVYTTFNLTPEHTQYDNNRALRKALKYNYKDVVKWLLAQNNFNLT